MLAQIGSQCNVQNVHQQLDKVVQWVKEAAADGTSAHAMEKRLLRSVLDLGLTLSKSFFHQVGPGDLGPTVTLPEGRTLNRLPGPGIRRLLTIFGAIEIPRFGYGTRERQKIELVPTDQRLQLPESDLSYPLQEWDQMLGVEHAFGKVAKTLHDMIDLKQSVDTLERGNQQMAEAAPQFRAEQPAPDPAAEGEILVVSEDNKGVPMVRPVQSVPAGVHRKKGEKANTKQMACIGCVYTVNPHVRTPDELIAALFRDPGRGERDAPQASQKRYWAELTRTVAGNIIRAQDQVFKQMAGEVKLRRKPNQKMVHLSDGQRSLETDRVIYLPIDVDTVDILDLMHVLPRMWGAAHLFHAEGSDAAKQFVRERLPLVLNGMTDQVIAELRQMGASHHLRGTKSSRLRRICDYLKKNLYRMKYDEYLKAGYPIATGVIEGACRHVIKDRVEGAGMRWKVPGAHAMLQLRTITANGDWGAFLESRIEQETRRLYPHRDAVEAIPWPIAA